TIPPDAGRPPAQTTCPSFHQNRATQPGSDPPRKETSMTGTPRTWGSTTTSTPGRLALSCLLLAVLSPVASAQNTYPTPNLTSLVPPGAKAGSTLEVTFLGNDLEEPS